MKNALRALIRNTGSSFLNLSGLVLGMMSVIFIVLFITDELSFDRFHKNAGRIYRLVGEGRFAGPILQAPLAPLLSREIPEIANQTRFYSGRAFGNKHLLSRGDRHVFMRNFLMADPSFFEVFSFRMLAGNRSRPLSAPDSLVLTRSAAERLFREENPVGRQVFFEHRFEFIVSAVMEDVPRNSHFGIDAVVPLDFYERFNDSPGDLRKWNNSAFMSYMLLSPGADLSAVQAKIEGLVKRSVPPDRVGPLRLQPLTDIHLRSHSFYELAANSDIRYVFVFGAVALLILLTAGINYVNLSTARALGRAREVGLRKVVGARRGQLIRQFLLESVLLCELALVAALALATVLMPAFGRLTGRFLSTSLLLRWDAAAIAVAGAGLLGLAAGGIPALTLSAFQPHQVLSGKLRLGKGGSDSLRKILVTAQFSISIALIACSGILYRQMNYIRARNLGFNPDQVVVVHSNRNEGAVEKMPLVAERFRSRPEVIHASVSSHTPGIPGDYRVMHLPGKNTKGSRVSTLSLWMDADFAETYQLEFAAGRDFSRKIATDRTSAYILNETGIRALGWASAEEAVGRTVECNSRLGTVIGVVRDFHFQSLHSKIEPIIFLYEESRFYAVSARIGAGNVRDSLAALRSEWESVLPDIPFDYVFVDDQFAGQYREDQRVGRVMSIFTLLAVAISCLGLFGLAVYSTGRRIKEIGVRKILGASRGSIAVLLAREFLRGVVLANLLAWPAAYLVMRKWLEGFAYRIAIELAAFLAAGVLALAVALATVGYQALKAAAADPIHALRHE